MSTLETLYGCQFILSTQLIIKTTSSRGTSSFQLQSVPYNVHQDMQSNTRNYLTMNFLCQWVGWQDPQESETNLRPLLKRNTGEGKI